MAQHKLRYLPFHEAKSFVQKIGLKSYQGWFEYCKSGKKPRDIPVYPMRVYVKEWKGIGDWLGTERIANQNRTYRNFENARSFARLLGIKTGRKWNEYCKSGKKPHDIPSGPNRIYKNNWKGWGDWLGTGYVASYKRSYRSFEDAKQFVKSLGLKSEREWKTYSRSIEKPDNIPNSPAHVYKTEWKGIGDWLGTGYVALYKRNYRNFEEARRFVHSLGIRNREEWSEYCKSGKKPKDVPNKPNHVYKNYWNGWGDWLGTGWIANQNRVYRNFEDARKFVQTLVQTLDIRNREEWSEYCKSGKKPDDIPASPWQLYRNQWISMSDWLGYEEPTWSIRKIKRLLKDLIESGIIYTWSEAVLYSFLLRKGLLNLYYTNRHRDFFKNLIQAARTSHGRKEIEQYTFSDSSTPPNLHDFSDQTQNTETEIETASIQDLTKLSESSEPLDYGKPISVEQVLTNTSVLESINVDEEAMQFYLNYSIDELWKLAFQNEEKTVNEIRFASRSGNKYTDAVIESFLTDYKGSKEIKPPAGYSVATRRSSKSRYILTMVRSMLLPPKYPDCNYFGKPWGEYGPDWKPIVRE